MKRLPAIVAAGLLAASLFGCGSEREPAREASGPAMDPVLARVGDREILLSEFQQAFENAQQEDERHAPDSTSARSFLDDMISRALMDQVARDSVSWNPLLEHRASSHTENLMVHKMRYEAYGYAGEVSDSLVEYAHELARTEYRYRALLFATEAEAQRWSQALRSGTTFDEAARQLLGSGEDGDQGWRSTYNAPLIVIELVRTLAPGEIGGPVEARNEWYLVQAVDQRPNENTYPLEQTARPLRLRITQDRAARPAREYREGILEKYRYTPDLESVEWFNAFFYEATQSVPRSSDLRLSPGESPGNVIPADWSTCPLNEQEQRRILATTTVDTIHAILLLDHFISQPSFSWPRFDKIDDTIVQLEALVMDRLERVEAWERGYDQHPEIQEASRQRRELIRARQLMQRIIRPRSRPTMEQTQAWYEQRILEQGRAEQRDYALVTFATAEDAERARPLLRGDRDMRETMTLIQRIDPSAALESGAGLSVTQRPDMSAMEEELFKLRLHEVTSPLPKGARFALARVDRIVPGQGDRPFEEVAEEVHREYSALRADSLLAQYIEQRRQVTEISIHEDVFKRVNFDPAR